MKKQTYGYGPQSNTTGYQPGEENPEPYYEQHGDPESGELADPEQEVPYEEYQEQEVPEEEGVPEKDTNFHLKRCLMMSLRFLKRGTDTW